MFQKQFEHQKEAIYSEHLKDGVRPIIASVSSREQFFENPNRELDVLDNYSEAKFPDLDNTDFFGIPEKLADNGYMNGGHDSYVISPIDSFDKISKKYRNCTGVVVAGIDKSGQEISFVSHQYPRYFLGSPKDRDIFLDDFSKRLEELRNRCIDGTVDAIILGGNYLSFDESYQEMYLKSIKLLSEKTKEKLRFQPAVITGPKISSGEDDIYYDNAQRRLYIFRPKETLNATSGSYSPTNLEDASKTWLDSEQ